MPQDVDAAPERRYGGEDLLGERLVPRRAGGAEARQVRRQRAVAPQGTADFAVEVQAEPVDRLAHRPAPGEPAAGGAADLEQLQELDGRRGVEVDQADVEHRVAEGVQRPGLGLLGGRRLLQEPPHLAAGPSAVDAVSAGLLGQRRAADAGHPRRPEHDLFRREAEEHVARGDHHLPGARRRGGQAEIDRQLAVEKRGPQALLLAPGSGTKTLPHGP